MHTLQMLRYESAPDYRLDFISRSDYMRTARFYHRQVPSPSLPLSHSLCVYFCVYVHVCASVCMCLCMCVCVRARGTD